MKEVNQQTVESASRPGTHRYPQPVVTFMMFQTACVRVCVGVCVGVGVCVRLRRMRVRASSGMSVRVHIYVPVITP